MASHFIKNLRLKQEGDKLDRLKSQEACARILAGCTDKQRPFVADMSLYQALRCPRRSGKSFGLTSKCLFIGEKIPGSRILIISLTLKSTKENFWSGAPGGLFYQNDKYELDLEYNHASLVWTHPNGSRGRLAGAETFADIERLRGAAAEADLVVIDEGKSFAPSLLTELIINVVRPGLMTREGILVMAGTPGSIPLGPFYEATCERARTAEDRVTCWPVGATGPLYDDLSDAQRAGLYQLYSWTIQDNTAKPHQWARALLDKESAGWTDDHPTWRREFLGEWVSDVRDLVYAYADARDKLGTENVCWRPPKFKDRAKDNPTGLPVEGAPWHMVLGIDFGYEDDSAFVMVAWSETWKQLRHVYDFKGSELPIDDFATEIQKGIDIYGQPEMMVADAQGKQLIETMNQRYGWGIQAAEKREKFDFIELLNSDFMLGMVKIIPNSDLELELLGLQYDLSRDSKTILARTGKLREDPKCPNHLCDAFLYIWRWCYHYWAADRRSGLTPGTAEANIEEMNREMRERASSRQSRVESLGDWELDRMSDRMAYEAPQSGRKRTPWN